MELWDKSFDGFGPLLSFFPFPSSSCSPLFCSVKVMGMSSVDQVGWFVAERTPDWVAG